MSPSMKRKRLEQQHDERRHFVEVVDGHSKSCPVQRRSGQAAGFQQVEPMKPATPVVAVVADVLRVVAGVLLYSA